MPSLHSEQSKQSQPGITEKINDAIKPKGALKPRVQDGVKKLQLQIKNLDSMLKSGLDREGKLLQQKLRKELK